MFMWSINHPYQKVWKLESSNNSVVDKKKVSGTNHYGNSTHELCYFLACFVICNVSFSWFHTDRIFRHQQFSTCEVIYVFNWVGINNSDSFPSCFLIRYSNGALYDICQEKQYIIDSKKMITWQKTASGEKKIRRVHKDQSTCLIPSVV